jgi:hypothetical protein
MRPGQMASVSQPSQCGGPYQVWLAMQVGAGLRAAKVPNARRRRRQRRTKRQQERQAEVGARSGAEARSSVGQRPSGQSGQLVGTSRDPGHFVISFTAPGSPRALVEGTWLKTLR